MKLYNILLIPFNILIHIINVLLPITWKEIPYIYVGGYNEDKNIY